MGANRVLALKIDVDTERGTKLGVPNLLKLLLRHEVPATFLFSLGPDNTGRAIRRIFRAGFLKKISRTSVVRTYGIKTLLNGVLWPGPHIARRHATILRSVTSAGYEVGIHSYDHFKWQDYLNQLTYAELREEFLKARQTFESVFSVAAHSAGAPGWQSNANSLAVYDDAKLVYGSDCRGTTPFFPRIHDKIFSTLQLPTTLPTLDELMGRPEFPERQWSSHFISQLSTRHPNVFTCHAEIEGLPKLQWFDEFILRCKQEGIIFKTMVDIAQECLAAPAIIPVCEWAQGSVDGRSGELAKQGAFI